MKAIVTRVETVRRGQVFRVVKFGEPMDWVLRIHFTGLDDSVTEPVRGWEVFNLSKHPDSKLARFRERYGAPVRGLVVELVLEDGFWRIKMRGDDNEGKTGLHERGS